MVEEADPSSCVSEFRMAWAVHASSIYDLTEKGPQFLRNQVVYYVFYPIIAEDLEI